MAIAKNMRFHSSECYSDTVYVSNAPFFITAFLEFYHFVTFLLFFLVDVIDNDSSGCTEKL